MARRSNNRPALDAPVLVDGEVTGNKVSPGSTLEFNFTPIEQITYEAELDSNSSDKGTVEVDGNTVRYTAHNPESSEEVVVKVKAKNVNDEYSEDTLDLNIEVVVTTLEVETQINSISVGSTDTEINVRTNADSITAESDQPELLNVSVDDKKVIFRAVAEGTANVTIRATADGGVEKAITWGVTITANETLAPVEFTIDPTTATIYGQGTITIGITGDLDSIVAESNTPSKVNVDSQSTGSVVLRGVAKGSGKVSITGSKTGMSDSTIVIPVTIREETTLTIKPNNDLSMFKGETKVFKVSTNAADFNMESLTPSLATINKEKKSVTILSETGVARIKFTAQKDGSNMTSVTLDIVCKVKEATQPVLDTEVLEVDSSDILELNYIVEEGDTLVANLLDNSKGSVRVVGNKVLYTAPKVSNEDSATIVAKTTRGSSSSSEVVTSVTVKAPQAVKRPVLLTNDKNVVSGDTRVLSFTIDEDSTLVIENELPKGNAVVKANTITFEAPNVKKSEDMKIVVYATKDGFPESTRLEFRINIIANGEEPVKLEEDYPIRDLTLDELKGIMKDENIPLADKMEIFKQRGPVEQRLIISKISDYCDKMAPKKGKVSGDVGASQNFDLYNVILDVVQTENVERFKINFDMINAMFLVNNKEGDALHWVAVQRFDLQWKYGKRSLTSYQNLVHIITTLCDLSTRQEFVTGIDFDKALDKNTTTISDVAKSNIVGYYKS